MLSPNIIHYIDEQLGPSVFEKAFDNHISASMTNGGPGRAGRMMGCVGDGCMGIKTGLTKVVIAKETPPAAETGLLGGRDLCVAVDAGGGGIQGFVEEFVALRTEREWREPSLAEMPGVDARIGARRK